VSNYEPLYQTVGRVGRDPEIKQSTKGPFVTFSVAINQQYDDTPPLWIDVSVFNEGLQASVLRDIYKGAKVAIEGAYSVREYEGKSYPRVMAFAVGLVEWLRKEQVAAAASAPQPPAEDFPF